MSVSVPPAIPPPAPALRRRPLAERARAEAKFRPGIDDHDFEFRTRHAREVLGDGNKVKVTRMFRGLVEEVRPREPIPRRVGSQSQRVTAADGKRHRK